MDCRFAALDLTVDRESAQPGHTDAGVEQEPDDGFVATFHESPPVACLQQRHEVVVGHHGNGFLRQRGLPDLRHGIGVEFLLGKQPADEVVLGRVVEIGRLAAVGELGGAVGTPFGAQMPRERGHEGGNRCRHDVEVIGRVSDART